MRPRHIDFGEICDGVGDDLLITQLHIFQDLLLLPVQNVEIGEEIHLVEQTPCHQFLILRVLLGDEVRKDQHGPFPAVVGHAVQDHLQQLVGTHRMV